MADDVPRIITRRALLRGVGTVGAAAVGAQAGLLVDLDAAPAAEAAQNTPAPRVPADRDVLEHLTAAESDTLNAMVARIIPSDDHGPGAIEARAARYIDRALGGALAESRQAYAAGLAALDQHAQTSRHAPFHALPPADQDALLTELEQGGVAGFAGGSAAFFALVRTHTLEGTFGDPYYGGNANFIGWDMIGYPGVRTVVTASDQRMSEPPPRIHKSAYDYEMFTKGSATSDHTDH